jgi:hypothetical protein
MATSARTADASLPLPMKGDQMLSTKSTPNSFIDTSGAVQSPRKVERLVVGAATSDGAGVRLTRVLTQPLQRRLDPFLMLDAFATNDPQDYIGGFPDHPHRGFETVTYMIAGRMRHRDSAGNEGLLEDGGVQWMSAGRGVIHSELPEQNDGRMEGFQLWINLPARDKMNPPWYRDIASRDIPEFMNTDGVSVRVIAGASHGVPGAVQREATRALYLDVHFGETGGSFAQPLPAGHNAFVHVYRGAVDINGSEVAAQQMAILRNDPASDGVVLRASGPARVLLLAGQPLNEPIAQYGPFVMNTNEQIFQAIADFNAGRFAKS